MFGRKKETSLGDLILHEQIREILESPDFFEELLLRAQVESSAFWFLFKVLNGEGLAKETVKRVEKTMQEILLKGEAGFLKDKEQGAFFTGVRHCSFSPEEKARMIVEGVGRGMVNPRWLSYPHIMEKFEDNPEGKKVISGFLMKRMDNLVAEYKEHPFSPFGGKEEVMDIIEFLKEIPTLEVQGFLKKILEDPVLRYTEIVQGII